MIVSQEKRKLSSGCFHAPRWNVAIKNIRIPARNKIYRNIVISALKLKNVAVLPGYVYPFFDEMCNLHRYRHKIDINKILVTLE